MTSATAVNRQADVAPTGTGPARRFWLPPVGACDCHAHIFGPADRYPMVPERAYTPAPASVSAYRALMRRLGLSRVVLVQPSVYGFDNRCLLDALEAFGDDARGVIMADRQTGEAELATLHARGVRGVRCNLLLDGGPDLDALVELAPRIGSLGWHLDVNLDAGHLPNLERRLARMDIPVVVDHLAGIRPDARSDLDTLGGLLASRRIWLKVSSIFRLSNAPRHEGMGPVIERLVSSAPDQVLWGSDWPHPLYYGPPVDDHAVLDTVLATCGDDSVRHALMVDNPARLYGFAAIHPEQGPQARASNHQTP